MTYSLLPPATQSALLDLISYGLKGDPGNFGMASRILAKKLKPVDEELTIAINSRVADSIMRGSGLLPPPVDADSRQQLLLEEPKPVFILEPIWSEKLASHFLRVVKEYKHRALLLKENLTPSRSILLEGPPGVGKTLSAHWLAAKLKLPLLTLDLSTVMSSYLGKTGNNIRSVLKHAQQRPCVLLLDEFDAIAKRRDDDSDVGELKRLVTVLLQAIDDWPDTSLLVAATNHGKLLDPAVWRRFDLVINFGQPTESCYKRFLLQKGCPPGLSQWLAETLKNISLATLEKTVNIARKNALLNDLPFDEQLAVLLELNYKDFLASDSLSNR